MLEASELEAVSSIVQTLESLNAEARARVMLYLRGRLDAMGTVVPTVTPITEDATRPKAERKSTVVDIRTLKNEKDPKSDIEMAAVVAYYLQEEAPTGERNDRIGSSDLLKYFKQAGYPLPKRPRYTLTNAKNAGYLDQVAQGVYRLNPVGYNLVAHSLPSSSARPRGEGRTNSRRTPRQKRGASTRARGKPKT
jgi:hypothetical protein